jgi:acyl-CoA reductase-like NAD-dependent aldehyde dehydrogenase
LDKQSSARHRVARHMESGMIWIRIYCDKRVNPGSLFGGMKGSGYGRGMDFGAMRDYTEPKSAWVNVDPPFYPR